MPRPVQLAWAYYAPRAPQRRPARADYTLTLEQAMPHHQVGQVDELIAWFRAWETCINAVDLDAARRMFHRDVVGFGTHKPLLLGIDELANRQWAAIWGSMSGFRFLLDESRTWQAPDGLSGWGICPWTSTGYAADGTAFPRPGRATVLFARQAMDDPWLAVHTHISLAPGVPQRTFGPGGEGERPAVSV
ncbi:nuclear transport factor 2 family protein [Hoyosella sp. G463]|uniref:Nuclear transport factor 2 family protein n=1 Tax=Lolliginicoccus lacisalsi TaxID=2742202 RepID=A0A927JEY0_9ACTN|nr:nuclear transport factor 2 family protein [Lolliginicoccus lacisalsi]MBD8507407.1 nuclear transport factor 2 family protein [Lolliginicoccus lacisalsi]